VTSRISTQGVADDSSKAACRPRESLNSVREGPLDTIVYIMRPVGLNKAQLMCSSTTGEHDGEGTSRNMGAVDVVGVHGVTGVIGGDDSSTTRDPDTDRLWSAIGELSQKAGDCQPPWQKGLLWVDTDQDILNLQS
jgi:hypothetical protein